MNKYNLGGHIFQTCKFPKYSKHWYYDHLCIFFLWCIIIFHMLNMYINLNVFALKLLNLHKNYILKAIINTFKN